ESGPCAGDCRTGVDVGQPVRFDAPRRRAGTDEGAGMDPAGVAPGCGTAGGAGERCGPVTETAAAALVDDLITKQQRAGNMLIELPPVAALQLAGVVLLALKHPDMPPSHRTIGSAIVALVRDYFADCPAIAAVLDADAESESKTRH